MEDEKKCRVGGMYESNLLLGVALDYCMTTGTHAKEADARVAFLRWPVMRAACREFGPRWRRAPALVPQHALVPGPRRCGATHPGCHLCGHARGAQAARL